MTTVQKILFHYQGPKDANFAATHKPEAIRSKVNAGRLKSQVFACELSRHLPFPNFADP